MKKAFLNHYMSILPSLQSFVAGQVPNLADAEDLLQEIALVLWNRFDTYDPQVAKFRTWAFGVAKHKIWNHNRKTGRSKVIFNADLIETMSPSFHVTFEEDCRKKEALKTCLKEMSEKNKQMIALYYEQKKPCAFIAEKLNRKLSAVYTQIHRLREALRNCINGKVLLRGYGNA